MALKFLLIWIEGLTVLKEAIEAVYPKAEIQRCIIHHFRNTFKFVSYKDLKKFSKSFKEVYKAVNEEVALDKLSKIEEKWGRKYPYAIKSWKTKCSSRCNTP